MSGTTARPTNAAPTRPTGAAISDSIVALMHQHTGRGPTRARTRSDGETIVVTLRNVLTRGERKLVECGGAVEVLRMRRVLQTTMRDDLIAAVERQTGRAVQGLLSDTDCELDVTVNVFLMDQAPSPAAA